MESKLGMSKITLDRRKIRNILNTNFSFMCDGIYILLFQRKTRESTKSAIWKSLLIVPMYRHLHSTSNYTL